VVVADAENQMVGGHEKLRYCKKPGGGWAVLEAFVRQLVEGPISQGGKNPLNCGGLQPGNFKGVGKGGLLKSRCVLKDKHQKGTGKKAITLKRPARGGTSRRHRKRKSRYEINNKGFRKLQIKEKAGSNEWTKSTNGPA